MKRTLTLKREHLADLDPAELGSVVAGQELSGAVSCPVRYCLINTNLICMDYTWAC